MEQKVIRIANIIARSKSNLTLIEQRILCCALAQIKHGQKISSKDVFVVPFSELRDIAKKLGNSFYNNLKASLTSIVKKTCTIELTNEKGEEFWAFTWIQCAYYNTNTRQIIVQFSDPSIPYISDLKGDYTGVNLEEVRGFHSVYSWPVYSRLSIFKRDEHYGIKDYWTEVIPVEKMRFITNSDIRPSYGDWSKFRERVLDVALDDINKSPNTVFSAKYSVARRQGNRIVSLRFEMRRKDKRPRKRYVLPYKDAILSEKQLVMIADWLSGNNETRAARCSFDLDAFYQMIKEKYMKEKIIKFSDTLAYRNFLIGLLAIPDFVAEIYDPWLKQLGFATKKQS